jgi:aminopeptidase
MTCTRRTGHPAALDLVCDRALLRLGSQTQATWLPEVEQQAMQWADVSIVLRAGDLVHEDGALPVERVAARRGALGRVSATRTAGTRWVIVRLPTPNVARQAGLTLDDLTEAFFGAVLRDWAQARDAMQRVVERLADAREVHIQGRGTDLRLSMAGRTWLLDDGHINMPGGELATSPVEDSAEGEVLFEGPAVFAGHVFEGIRLRFEAGLAVEARADRNDALFQALLGIDEGARRVGEVGFGTNPGLRTLCGDLFYDEKVPGTFHLALGRSYASCGGRNPSALHWDIVKDLRGEGSVTVDGQVVVGLGGLVK